VIGSVALAPGEDGEGRRATGGDAASLRQGGRLDAGQVFGQQPAEQRRL
jgi:hypothetical protein